VGGSVTIDVDVRVIAATNRDLKEEVAAGRFREDLFYRLNVVHIPVPPLRERSDDLPLLVAHFVKKYTSEEAGAKELKLAPEALKAIYGYNWPGNVRELENAIERAVILSSGHQIGLDDLPDEVGQKDERPKAYAPQFELDELVPPGASLGESLESIEKRLIERALDRADHVQAHAAELLGIKKNLMQYKMKKYGLL
jgi:two-component system NtrC family response regulator